MLTNPYVIAIAVPFLLLVSGTFAKKLVRGRGWQLKDSYLGIESVLAAMASGLLHLFDLARRLTQLQADQSAVGLAINMVATAGFIVAAFFLFLLVLTLHQDYESEQVRSKTQLILLGVVANLIGVSLIVIFVLEIKGVGEL